MKLCSACFGRGDVWKKDNKTFSGLPAARYWTVCPTCNGKGHIDDEPLADEHDTGPNSIISVKLKRVKNGK